MRPCALGCQLGAAAVGTPANLPDVRTGTLVQLVHVHLTNVEGDLRAMQVATLDAARRQGVGSAIVNALAGHARAQHPTLLPKLDAQTYAIPFYAKLGWQQYGAEFDDDAGLPHLQWCWCPRRRQRSSNWRPCRMRSCCQRARGRMCAGCCG
jgi:GNAT superfamily N-acetyltransferase